MTKLIFSILVSGTLASYAAAPDVKSTDSHGGLGSARARYVLTPGKTFDELKVGSGSLVFGQSLVFRVAVDGFVVCELKGYECTRVPTLTEAQALIDAQAAAKKEGDDGTIAQILATVAEQGANDYAFTPEQLENAARDPKAMQALVAELVNVEEAFSARINQILHSDLAKNLKDDSKLLLSGLLFADRNRLMREKLDGVLKELDRRNTVQDPRIDGLKTVIAGKEGFLSAFNQAYAQAQADQVQKIGQTFNDVGCPACQIARNLESELPGLVGMARKQLPRGDKVGTKDGKIFIVDGKTFVRLKDKEGYLWILDPQGKRTNLQTNDKTHQRISKAYTDYVNAGSAVPKAAVTLAPPPSKPVATTMPVHTAAWARDIEMENDLVQKQYPQAVNELLEAPDQVSAARQFFRHGPFYQSKKEVVDGFLNDPRFEQKAPGLLREFLKNRTSRYRHCPSCWLGERFQWNPHH